MNLVYATEYDIQMATCACPTDEQLERLLHRVYVDGGFADQQMADEAFVADRVRSRGHLLVAVQRGSQQLAGMVILVPPGAPACQLADAGEAELQLLAVAPEHRNQGVGRTLLASAIRRAQRHGFEKMLLWTQPSMQAAHRLYEAVGFERRPAEDFQKGDRSFWVMQAELL